MRVGEIMSIIILLCAVTAIACLVKCLFVRGNEACDIFDINFGVNAVLLATQGYCHCYLWTDLPSAC